MSRPPISISYLIDELRAYQFDTSIPITIDYMAGPIVSKGGNVIVAASRRVPAESSVARFLVEEIEQDIRMMTAKLPCGTAIYTSYDLYIHDYHEEARIIRLGKHAAYYML